MAVKIIEGILKALLLLFSRMVTQLCPTSYGKKTDKDVAILNRLFQHTIKQTIHCDIHLLNFNSDFTKISKLDHLILTRCPFKS